MKKIDEEKILRKDEFEYSERLIAVYSGKYPKTRIESFVKLTEQNGHIFFSR